MKKENTLLVIIGGVAALGLSYFLYRRFTKKGEQRADEIRQQGQQAPTDQPSDLPPLLPVGTGNPLTDLASNITNFLNRYQDYEVVTKTNNLNLRQRPDSQSRIIGSLRKGSSVRAKASGVKGWFAVSDNDKDIKGYVSQTFLKPKTK